MAFDINVEIDAFEMFVLFNFYIIRFKVSHFNNKLKKKFQVETNSVQEITLLLSSTIESIMMGWGTLRGYCTPN